MLFSLIIWLIKTKITDSDLKHLSFSSIFFLFVLTETYKTIIVIETENFDSIKQIISYPRVPSTLGLMR